MSTIPIEEKVRDVIIEIRAMEFDGKIDSILEQEFIHSTILHYRKYHGVEKEDFDEIFEELYGVSNYIDDYYHSPFHFD